MAKQRLKIRRVAVIGAGVSGVAAAIHLKRAGLEVTVYERNARAGGIWCEIGAEMYGNTFIIDLCSIGYMMIGYLGIKSILQPLHLLETRPNTILSYNAMVVRADMIVQCD